MGKRLSAGQVRAARPRETMRLRTLVALALVVLMAGCVASSTASDKDRPRDFYGGVSAGDAVP
jgi:hypothetical protein